MNKEFYNLLKMNFGFITVNPECRDGWFLLLWKLCNDIKASNPPKDFESTQIKEKFATLRFYVTYIPSDKIDDLINKAEIESGKVCDICGKNGSLYDSGGCYRTRCADHSDWRQNIYNTPTLV